MTVSSTNVRTADSCSTSTSKENAFHVFPWKWSLSELKDVPWNGFNVFSCFSCGGGSSMGYKRAGFHVLGNVEIDRDMNKIYCVNHKPKYNYNMDIRDFNAIPNEELPEELFNLDILDSSPPCSTFSAAGEREKGWNTEKQFREGQKMQRLDDLFFVFIETVKKLKPKTVIAENVKGLISGKAKGYVAEIIKAFKEAGYSVQIFLLNASAMGVPQRRERVFFIAHRNDLKLPKLALDFSEPPIYFKDVRSKDGVPLKPGTQTYELMKKRIPSDTRLSDICIRLYGRNSGFTNYIWSDEQVSGTIASGGSYFRMYDGMGLSNQDFINIQTFPQDYNFVDQSVQYVCGMSVPPVMMAQISRQVYLQWLRKLKQ